MERCHIWYIETKYSSPLQATVTGCQMWSDANAELNTAPTCRRAPDVPLRWKTQLKSKKKVLLPKVIELLIQRHGFGRVCHMHNRQLGGIKLGLRTL